MFDLDNWLWLMKLRIVTLHKYTADDIISVLTSNVPYPIFVVLTCFMQCIKVFEQYFYMFNTDYKSHKP